MFVAFFNFTDPNPNKALSDVNREQYEKTIDNFNNAYGRWSILLSHKFFEESKYQMWIYLGINYEDDDDKKKDYRTFVANILNDQFATLCKQELGFNLEVPKDKFAFAEWKYEDVDSKGAKVYAREQLKRWKQWKQERDEKKLVG